VPDPAVILFVGKVADIFYTAETIPEVEVLIFHW
jgi:hypothetical protein